MTTDLFYEPCQTHGARRCPACQIAERKKLQQVSTLPVPTDSVRHRVDVAEVGEPIEISEEMARKIQAGEKLVNFVDGTDDELNAVIKGELVLFSQRPPEVAVGSHEEKVMKATFRYIAAYSGRKNAATEIERAQVAVTAALEKEKTAAAEQESARDELFDLIALEDSKPA